MNRNASIDQAFACAFPGATITMTSRPRRGLAAFEYEIVVGGRTHTAVLKGTSDREIAAAVAAGRDLRSMSSTTRRPSDTSPAERM